MSRDHVKHHYSYNSSDTGGTTEVTVITIHHGDQDHIVSWSILWGAYLIALGACLVQVCMDRRAAMGGSGGGGGGGGSGGSSGGGGVSSGNLAHSHRQALSDAEQGAAGGDGGSSSGETTRQLFYKLLLFAILSRCILLPIQIFVYPNRWWQWFGETFPYLSFASAWTLLVSFFVQLVGTASGSGAGISLGPSIVMQVTGYIVYGILCIMYVWNGAASILLFALLSCIYAALFGTLVYFGPRLVTILKPSLVRRSGLAMRLVSCCGLCLVVFFLRTIGLARKIVAPPIYELWWWNYGALELLPSMALLVMMHPHRKGGGGGGSSSSSNKSLPNNAASGTTPPSRQHGKTATSSPSDSTSRGGFGLPKQQQQQQQQQSLNLPLPPPANAPTTAQQHARHAPVSIPAPRVAADESSALLKSSSTYGGTAASSSAAHATIT